MLLYCLVVLLYLVLMDLYIVCTDLDYLVVEICYANKSTKITFIFGKFSVVWPLIDLSSCGGHVLYIYI